MREIWAPYPSNPNYWVSSAGEVRKDGLDGHIMANGRLRDGSVTVSLSQDGRQKVYLLRRVVAETFCLAPFDNCDSVIHLDGDQRNCQAYNLAWRPRWFAWQYSRQFNLPILPQWELPVINLDTLESHPSMIAAGMCDGVLWKQLSKGVFEQKRVYPHGYMYVIDEAARDKK